MNRLNRGQRIAVLAALAFLAYVVGHFIIAVVFTSGFVVYEPESSGVDWTVIWQNAVQVGIWLVLTAAWVVIAVRSLRGDPTSIDEAAASESPQP